MMFQNFKTIKHLVLEGISKIGYVMTSKITSQHQAKQELRHEVKNYVMASKLSQS